MKKRICSLLLMLIMIVSLFPGLDLRANASNLYSIQGAKGTVQVRWDEITSSPNDCWNYASYFWKKVWGKSHTNNFDDSANCLRELSDNDLTLTADHLKAFVSHAKLGSVLRVCNAEFLHGTDGWGHSLFIVQKDSNGFTAFEGGLSASPYCREKYYTWDAFVKSYGHYKYIKYIKWPAAELYVPCKHSWDDVGVCKNGCGKSFDFLASKDTGVAGKYEITLKGGVYPRTDKPYSASTKKADNIPKGKEVTVEYSVKNHWGNVWYYVSYNGTKGYVSADNMKWKSHLDQQISCSITSPAENASVPRKAYPVAGTVTSRYAIAEIKAYLDGNLYATIKPNSTSVNLRSTDINNKLDFATLSSGKHTLVLKARDIHRSELTTVITRTFYSETPAPASFNVNLNANGGVCDVAKLSVTDGAAVGTLPTPTLQGYTFQGWYTEPYSGTKISSSTKVNGDVTYYAHWKHDGNKIEFDRKGDAAVVAQANGANISRAGAYLVAYNNSGSVVDTNIYGCEIAVESNGLVVDIREYGDPEHLIVPYDGFVLSGQHGWHEGATEAYGGYVDVKNILNIDSANKYVYFDYETGKIYAYTDYADYIANHKYVKNGENYGVLPVPHKTGYYHSGWYTYVDGEYTGVGYNTEYCGNDLRSSWVKPDDVGPVGYTDYNGHRYEYYQYHVNWHEAKEICEAKGGHLVTITSAEEQEHVEWFASLLYEGMYFIGCTDEKSEGSWQWVTGEPFDYTNWDINSSIPEPTGNTAENYGAIIAKDNPPNKQVGEWIDAPNLNYGTFYDISNTGFICEYENQACEHSWGYDVLVKPTLTDTGLYQEACYKCGQIVETTLPVLNKNDYYYWYDVRPTCEKSGLDSYTWLPVQEVDFVFYVDVPALGHSVELKNDKDASCTADGYTGDDVCKTCGKTIRTGQSIAAKGHKWDNGVIIKEATDTNEGLKRYTCTVCDSSYDETIPTTDHKHEFKDSVVEPTCTDGGYTLHKCSCGENYKDKYTDALGHNSELKNAKEATCTTDGYTGDEVCKRCNATTKKGSKISAKGHRFANGKCTVCGASDSGYVDPTPDPEPFNNPFVDVAEKDYFYEPVLWAVEKGVTGGINAMQFAPGNPCTRGQVVTFLWRANGSPEPQSTSHPFTDIGADKYYYKAVLWAVENGITSGLTATTFGPNNACTRGQIATFLWRANGSPEPQSSNSPFYDVTGGPFYKAILWAVEEGITTGYAGGTFRPGNVCTRGNIVTFLYRAEN